MDFFKIVKRISKVFPTIAVYLILLPALLSAYHQCKVIRIVDGDTIVIDYKNKYEKLRFLCVNTPESVHSDKKQNIPIGKVASDYTKTRLSRRYVDLEFEGPFRGRYGRLLAYVFVDRVNLNLEQVRQGLSPYYRNREKLHEIRSRCKRPN